MSAHAKNSNTAFPWVWLPVSIAALSLLVLPARANYLLFHSVVELFARRGGQLKFQL